MHHCSAFDDGLQVPWYLAYRDSQSMPTFAHHCGRTAQAKPLLQGGGLRPGKYLVPGTPCAANACSSQRTAASPKMQPRDSITDPTPPDRPNRGSLGGAVLWPRLMDVRPSDAMNERRKKALAAALASQLVA